MKRRTFLQRTGLALAALTASDVALAGLANRYRQVLAAPTSRKLALLVGINQYPSLPSLSGCLTDLDLQRELLISRFGFRTQDILILADQQATRSNIEAAFLSHLAEQTRPGDVVVFHFSGYGSTVSPSANPESLQPTLVTADEPSAAAGTVPDLLADTLVLLLRSLTTDKITTLLDTSYTYPSHSLQGTLRIRTRPNLLIGQPVADELAFQEQLLTRLQSDREQVSVQRRSGQIPGVVLAAAGLDQVASEGRWSGFSAGLFTYALTQQLWQATPATTLRISLAQATATIAPLADGQQPQFSGQKSREQSLPPYHILPQTPSGAEGVILSVEENGRSARAWLAGLPEPVLEQIGSGSYLSVGTSSARDADQDNTRLVQVVSRDGLTVKVRPVSVAGESGGGDPPPLQVGQGLQEQIRWLPRNLGLVVALDPGLGRIERVDAISALSTIPRVTAIATTDPVADYLFGKASLTRPQPTQVAALPSAALNSIVPDTSMGYGLFSPGRETVPNTIGDGGEAVKGAVRRLVPRLQTLLSTKLLTLLPNSGSSRLGVWASLEMVAPTEQVLLHQRSDRGCQAIPQSLPTPAAGPSLPILPIGSRIQYRLQNYHTQPIYFLLVGLDNNGNLVAFHPVLHESGSSTETLRGRAPGSLLPDEALTIPKPSATTQWIVRSPGGLVETYLLCSQAPFTQTQTALSTLGYTNQEGTPISIVTNPLEITQAILQDLHQASGSPPSGDGFALHVEAWAGFRFIYQVG